MLKGSARRATTALMVLTWITIYLGLAWYVGSSYVSEKWYWQILFFPLAGLLWVPGAIFIMKQMAEKLDAT